MSLRDVKNIALEYHTLSDNVIDDFYVPCLAESTLYKRASGFFSSTLLLRISVGLLQFIKNGGKIQLLISPKLSKEDYDAIKNGYDSKALIEQKVIDSFDFDIDFFQKEDRFGLLSYLIEKNILEIKIVAVDSENEQAMFHEKIGILKDGSDNCVAFSGSSNETVNGMISNYENIDVYCSWKSQDSEDRCFAKECDFDYIWNGVKPHLITISFPEVIKKELLKFRKTNDDYSQLDSEYVDHIISNRSKIQHKDTLLSFSNLHDYQIEAVNRWVSNNFQGIYDMATGTGKTFTAIGSILKLREIKKRVAVIICCPQKHLVDQWKEETDKFGLNAIPCHSETDYKKSLKREVLKFQEKRSDFFCAIICTDSLLSDYNYELYKINAENTLLIADEAHSLGSQNRSKIMQINVPYRLGLSATIERYGDEEGTNKLFDFFKGVCFSFTLEQALTKGYLTPYKYHPIVVSLNDDEYDRYMEISAKISKEFAKCKDKTNFSDLLQLLLIKRARIISECQEKIFKLKEILKTKYLDQKNILVYCGVVEYETEQKRKKQIDIVADMMTNELGITASKFTGEESPTDRQTILTTYKQGDIQSLVAIKCLDEGVDVPSIQTAFILASSTNPKEYIQRRGRVLRKYPGKQYADIYDFITLPHPLSCTTARASIDNSLVLREKRRMKEFSLLCSNPDETNEMIDKLDSLYDLTLIKEEEIL